MSGALIRLPSKKQIEWLIEQLNLCLQHARYEAALKRFRSEVEEAGLSFHSGSYSGFLDGDVYVQGAFQERGGAARKSVKKIVMALITSLTRYIGETRNT